MRGCTESPGLVDSVVEGGASVFLARRGARGGAGELQIAHCRLQRRSGRPHGEVLQS